MKLYQASQMTTEELLLLCRRPGEAAGLSDLLPVVREIIERVRRDGDEALFSYGQKFDGTTRKSPAVTPREQQDAERSVSAEFKSALSLAAGNIEAFHRAQLPAPISVETAGGILCRREWRPIERVGLYVPGGTAPLVSTVLMLGIPARLARCPEIVLCTPPAAGTVAPEILFAAASLGITRIFAVGGAQAIAAMACGTGSIPKVDKIFGPGSRYVTAAKLLVQQPPLGVAIDMLAGPSELLVIADETANPEWVAADLLSQAEHGPDSQVVLVATSAAVARSIEAALARRADSLPGRADLARKALEGSFALVVGSISGAIRFSNLYAPEHLSLAFAGAEAAIPEVTSAGSVFVGSFCSVVFGDYASGTNHTLPTNGSARACGGITVESFLKPVSFQTVTRTGYEAIAESVLALAGAEGLPAHAEAVRARGDSSHD